MPNDRQSDVPSIHLSVAEAYDRWATTYDAQDNPMVFASGQALARHADDMRGRDIFEFGCGTGRNLALLAALGARRLAGCDLSQGMLEQARERGHGFELSLHDMSRPLDVPDHSVDHALFALTLEHIADMHTPLAEARRIVRPGGHIFILEIHPFLTLGGIGAHFEADGQIVRMPTHPHQFADYLAAFVAAGLQVASCREWRPRDFQAPPARVLKRGVDTPLLVEFVLSV